MTAFTWKPLKTNARQTASSVRVKQLANRAEKSVGTRWSLALLPRLFSEPDLEHHVEEHNLNVLVGQSWSLIVRAGELASSLSCLLLADPPSAPQISFVSNQYHRHLALTIRLSDLFDEFDHLSRHFKAVMIVDWVHHDEPLAILYIRGFGLNQEKGDVALNKLPCVSLSRRVHSFGTILGIPILV